MDSVPPKRGSVFVGTVALMSAALATMVAGQNAGNQRPILPVGSGLILGQVVDGQTGRPVGSALVTLNASAIVAVADTGAPAAPGSAASRQPAAGVGARATRQTVIADANGRFVFHELPKATYAL